MNIIKDMTHDELITVCPAQSPALTPSLVTQHSTPSYYGQMPNNSNTKKTGSNSRLGLILGLTNHGATLGWRVGTANHIQHSR